MRTKNPLVILAVPHASCKKVPTKEHSCDIIAPNSAQAISERLNQMEISTEIMYSSEK